MSRSQRERLQDIAAACEAIESHLEVEHVQPNLVGDAIRMRLVEVGEAVKDLAPELTSAEREIPWSDISRMRDFLTHRYFDSMDTIIFRTARLDVPQLLKAVRRLLSTLDIPD